VEESMLLVALTGLVCVMVGIAFGFFLGVKTSARIQESLTEMIARADQAMDNANRLNLRALERLEHINDHLSRLERASSRDHLGL